MHRRRGNPTASVLNSHGLPTRRPVANRSSHVREQGNLGPITHTFEIDTGYFHCQEHRSFYPNFNYEVVKVQVTDRNAFTPTDTFHIINFPIDQLSEHLMREAATQLFNVRSIGLYNPLSWEVFAENYDPILAMTLNMLRLVPSLRRITLCVDILSDALFRILHSHSYLRELEILPPPSTTYSPDGLVQIGEVLNRGIALLPQVEYFKIPLEIVHSCPAMVDYLTSVS